MEETSIHKLAHVIEVGLIYLICCILVPVILECFLEGSFSEVGEEGR